MERENKFPALGAIFCFDTEIIGVVFGFCLLFCFFYILSMNTMDPVPLKTVFKQFSLWNI